MSEDNKSRRIVVDENGVASKPFGAGMQASPKDYDPEYHRVDRLDVNNPDISIQVDKSDIAVAVDDGIRENGTRQRQKVPQADVKIKLSPEAAKQLVEISKDSKRGGFVFDVNGKNAENNPVTLPDRTELKASAGCSDITGGEDCSVSFKVPMATAINIQENGVATSKGDDFGR